VRLALIAVIAILGSGPGCALDPFADETVPPVEDFGVRISAGLGSADPYLDAAEVGPDNEVQFRARIGDGRVIEMTAPRGPSEELIVTATPEGSDVALATVTLSSRTGRELSVDRLHSFDPGYVSIEDNSTEDELVLRIATPRLTGTDQGEVPFTFKMDVVPPGGSEGDGR
jgi:hypothetical protein